jgi:hypothetical protein
MIDTVMYSTGTLCALSGNSIYSPGYPNSYSYIPPPNSNGCLVIAEVVGTLSTVSFNLGRGMMGSDAFQVGLYRHGILKEYSYLENLGPEITLKPGDYFHFTPTFGTNGGSFELAFTPAPDGGVGVGSRTCFSGEDTLTLESGGTRTMAELQIGDRILSVDREGNFGFSPVVFLPHTPNQTPTTFLEVTTVSGKTVRMTKGHLLPLAATGALVPAKTLLKVLTLPKQHYLHNPC